MANKLVMVSGGFDPLHVGHLRMFQEASKLGDLVVVLNSDAWLMRKKGFIFMPFEERAELIAAYDFVRSVEPVDDTDGSVCEALRRVRPNIFANGGDRFADNIPEKAVCEELGIETVFNVGGGKVQSSSEMVKKAKNENSVN